MYIFNFISTFYVKILTYLKIDVASYNFALSFLVNFNIIVFLSYNLNFACHNFDLSHN